MSRHPAAIGLAAAAFAFPAVDGLAQETRGLDPVRVRVLIDDLSAPLKTEAAVQQLSSLGRAVVPPVLAAMERIRRDGVPRVEKRRYMMLTYLLGKLGQKAERAAPVLVEHLGWAADRLEPQILWALTEISPFGLDRNAESARSLRNYKPIAKDALLPWQIATSRLDLGRKPSARDIRDYLMAGRPPDYCIAAARALRDGLAPADVHRDDLLLAHDIAMQTWRRRATVIRGTYRLVAVETSHAVVKVAPETLNGVYALGYLLSHHDAQVRKDAASMLLLRRKDGRRVIRELTAALEDQSRPVVREVIFALANLGADAYPAVSALEKLQKSGDTEWRLILDRVMPRLHESITASRARR